MKISIMKLGGWVVGVMACEVMAQANLVQDASFESPVAAWFSEEGRGAYFANKEKVADATEGTHVLLIQGWEKNGSKIFSPPFDFSTNAYSGTIQMRSFGQVAGATVELALFDEPGKAKLASFGTTAVDGSGKWTAIQASNVTLAATRGRLAIVVSGPQHGARVEVDQAGLFAGSALGSVTDNADFVFFEAEDMANGKGWLAADHYTGWYSDLPSGMKMLAGPGPVTEADNQMATHTVTVREDGMQRLWALLIHVSAKNGGTYRIAVHQSGREVAGKEINDGDEKLGPQNSWVWVSLDADLVPGEAQVVVTRPAARSVWVSRKIDLFVLTNLLTYEPTIADFRPQGFLRWTNRSTNSEPFCLFVSVRRHQPPKWNVTPGMLSAAGWSGSYYVPKDHAKWIAPGESTPWVNISRFLLPGGGRNNVGFTATRNSHTGGYVTNEWRGTLEFAVGEERRVVRTVDIAQPAPAVSMTLPYDFEHQSEQIFTAFDYIEKSEAALRKIGPPHGSVATNLDLNTTLTLGTGTDPRVLERELAIIKSLGFNGTGWPIVDAVDAAAFSARHGLQQHFGTSVRGFMFVLNDCYNQPDVAKLDEVFKAQAEKFAPILNKLERLKLADEPSGPPYGHFAACDFCKHKFADGLKQQGLTPAGLGVATWDEVVPVLPKDSAQHPERFYYSGLFRLQTFADAAKASVRAKAKFLPPTTKTFVNYSPPTGDQLSWDVRGNDPIFLHRDGAFEMAWTEDWRGYGVTPQQMSPLYAQLRASGAPLGGYMVAVSGTPTIQRIKYYEWIAAGARHVNVYNYGPCYTSHDSWSANLDLFPVLSAVQHEFGAIDAALTGTQRHPTDVAILYNRTTGIWANPAATTEQDARYIHCALAHAGYDAAFIPEEDIVAGQLDQYKVLYLNGPQLRRDAAARIAAWVQRGGVLCGTAGAGSRDEFNRTNATLAAVFGVRSQTFALERDAGRPRYELRGQPALDELTTVTNSPITFNQLCIRETLVPDADTSVFLKNKSGEVAGVIHQYGKGTAIRIAAMPGLAYLNEATSGKDFDPEGGLVSKYRPELRDFIAWPAELAGALPVAKTTSTHIPEIIRYDGKDRAVIFIIDHNVTPLTNFVMQVPQASQFNRAYSASGNPVRFRTLKDGALEVSLPLEISDAVVLEKASSKTKQSERLRDR